MTIDKEDERERIASSNDIAGIIIDQAAEHRPDYFMDLTLRYAIADAILAAGYRKSPLSGRDWKCVAHGDTCAKSGLDWDCTDEPSVATLRGCDR